MLRSFDLERIGNTFDFEIFYFQILLLVQRCKNARRMIKFASPYLGTGKLESNPARIFRDLRI